MAEFLEISKQEGLNFLNHLGIDWLDYNNEELATSNLFISLLFIYENNKWKRIVI